MTAGSTTSPPNESMQEASKNLARLGRLARIAEITVYVAIGVAVLAALLLAMGNKWAYHAGMGGNVLLAGAAALMLYTLSQVMGLSDLNAKGIAVGATGLGAPLVYLGLWYLSRWTRFPAVLYPGIWYGTIRLLMLR